MTEGTAPPDDRGIGKLHVRRRGAETRSFKRFIGGPGFRAFVGLARRGSRGNGGSWRVLEVSRCVSNPGGDRRGVGPLGKSSLEAAEKPRRARIRNPSLRSRHPRCPLVVRKLELAPQKVWGRGASRPQKSSFFSAPWRLGGNLGIPGRRWRAELVESESMRLGLALIALATAAAQPPLFTDS